MRSVCGLWPLMVSHHASVSLRRFACGTHLLMRPMSTASFAVKRRAQKIIARAGLAEHGILRGNDQVAPQGELVAAAHAPAVDHGNDGDRQAADGHGETL